MNTDNELHIGMEVPRHTARQIHRWAEAQPWPEGTELEPPNKYHVTLLYANDGHDEADTAFWLEHMDEVEVTIDGMTVFPARHKDDGSYAYVFLINSPEVLDHAMMLQSRAKAWGIPVAEYPGGFHLHMTIAYGPTQSIAGIKAPNLAFHIGPSSISPKRVKENSAESVGVSDDETHNRSDDERDDAGEDQSWNQTLRKDRDEADNGSDDRSDGDQHAAHVEPEMSEFFHEDRVAYAPGEPIEPLNHLAHIAKALHECKGDRMVEVQWLVHDAGYEPTDINLTAAVEAWLTLYPEDEPPSGKIAATQHELSQSLRHYSAPEPDTPLYHWTDASELHNWMDPAHTGPGKTYLTQSGDVEDWNDDVPHYENPVRIQIDHSHLDPNAFDQDYHGWLGNYLYHGAIPQQAVSEIKSFKRPEAWGDPAIMNDEDMGWGRPPTVFEGERYGQLTVLDAGTPMQHQSGKSIGRMYRVRCDCGHEFTARGQHLRSGHTSRCLSCAHQAAGATQQKHGRGYEDPTYRSWDAMKARCSSSSHAHWHNYGGRGITIADRWLGEDGFTNFLADMGERPPGRTLDRKDNEGNYGPDNCQWSTPREQAQNRRPGQRDRSTVPTQVNDPADHWPEYGEMPPDKHQDIEFSNDWAWHQ